MLDTDTLSDLIRNPRGALVRRLGATEPDAVCTSIVVACELRFGARRNGSDALTHRVEQLLRALTVLPFDEPADHHYVDIRAVLERAGTPIGSHDLFIAAHARSRGMTLVTHNLREFEQVPGLRVEDWLAPPASLVHERWATGRAPAMTCAPAGSPYARLRFVRRCRPAEGLSLRPSFPHAAP